MSLGVDSTTRCEQSVLVTGASSGIGLETSRVLSAAGYRVFRGVRKLTGAGPGEEVCLDVTSQESIASAVETIRSKVGENGLWALVNNAGIGDLIPLEYTPIERFRAVIEVDLIGVVAVTQAFLPLLRQSRGRIVNIGSVGGFITIPFGSSLNAAKYAIESVSDALRLELHSAGIHVTCVEPASINSGSAEKLAARVEQTIEEMPEEGRARYGDAMRRFTTAMLKSETSGSPPEVVGEAVRDVLGATDPPARHLVGKDAHLLKFLGRHVPDAIRDATLRKLLLGEPVGE